MSWRTQDWFWLLAFWIYATAFSFIYNDLIMTVISYVSTFVSISLAGVAMFISLKQINQNDSLVGEMHRTLGSMNERLNQVDTKVSNFDPSVIKRDIEIDVNKIKEELIQEISKSLGSESNISDINTILDKVNIEVDKKIDELKLRIQESVDESLAQDQTIPKAGGLIRRITMAIHSFGNEHFTFNELMFKLPEVPGGVVKDYLAKMEMFGVLEQDVNLFGQKLYKKSNAKRKE